MSTVPVGWGHMSWILRTGPAWAFNWKVSQTSAKSLRYFSFVCNELLVELELVRWYFLFCQWTVNEGAELQQNGGFIDDKCLRSGFGAHSTDKSTWRILDTAACLVSWKNSYLNSAAEYEHEKLLHLCNCVFGATFFEFSHYSQYVRKRHDDDLLVHVLKKNRILKHSFFVYKGW